MPIFTYKAIDKTGKDIKGSITSESMTAAKTRLRSQGVMLTDIKEESSTSAAKKKEIHFFSTVSVGDLALMTRQLATLIRAKIQIVEALSALVDQSENPHLKVVLSEIKAKVNEGSSLAKAFGDYPKIFNNVFVNMVEAGEASGTLEVVLLRLADFTENQVKLRNRIRGAMTYPVIMISMGGLMMMLIFTLIIPKITKIFVTMKKTLPLQTQICIWISAFLKSYWWAILIALVLGFILLKKYIATEGGRANWDKLMLKLPIVGELVIMINVSRFCSTLATLLNSGVPILTAMKIVTNLISNVHIKAAVDESRTVVSEGASMVGPLIKCQLFPPMVTHMIKLGERSGELEPMLLIVSENYEDQVNTKLGGLTSVLEPIMMIGMGLAVAFIVFSVVAPMMELNSLKH